MILEGKDVVHKKIPKTDSGMSLNNGIGAYILKRVNKY
jgi:hypothetical protein